MCLRSTDNVLVKTMLPYTSIATAPTTPCSLPLSHTYYIKWLANEKDQNQIEHSKNFVLCLKYVCMLGRVCGYRPLWQGSQSHSQIQPPKQAIELRHPVNRAPGKISHHKIQGCQILVTVRQARECHFCLILVRTVLQNRYEHSTVD
jgi:hypothetical protein